MEEYQDQDEIKSQNFDNKVRIIILKIAQHSDTLRKKNLNYLKKKKKFVYHRGPNCLPKQNKVETNKNNSCDTMLCSTMKF